MQQKPKLALIVPCYNEEEVLNETIKCFSDIMNELVANNTIHPSSFIYFIDDGSDDQTWAIIEQSSLHNSLVKGMKFSKNFGHQQALIAGMSELRGQVDCVISIDGDLQHDESKIPEFINKYQSGADIVFGVRNNRTTDTILKKLTAGCFYKLMNFMGVNIIEDHADYRLVSNKVLNSLSDFKEVNLFLRGIFTELGYQTDIVKFDVRPRYAGYSKYSFRKMLSFALNGITSFSVVPLRMITLLGFCIFIFSAFISGYILFETLVIKHTVPGWASTVLPIYFIGGVQLLSIGLVGEYIGKIYKETKARPRYIKEDEIKL